MDSVSNVKGTPMESIVRDVLVRAASYASNGIVAQTSKTAPTAASGAVAAPTP